MSSAYEEVRARMESGRLYRDFGDGLEALEAERTACKELLYDFNTSRPSEVERRGELLTQLLGSVGAGAWIEPPLNVAYGSTVHIGDGFYANANLVLVDDGEVHIGDFVMIAPNVTISTTGHPIHPDVRRGGAQFSLPVHIGDDGSAPTS